MRVLVWGINYAPEATGIAPYNADLARHLAAAGHRVTMLTTFPYYPEWRKRPGDRGRLFRQEADGAVDVRRCWHYVPPPDRVTTVRRFLHEATFVATSALQACRLPAWDVAIVVSPPLPVAATAPLFPALHPRAVLLHVQDLQPDAAIALGMVPAPAAAVLRLLERVAYAGAHAISTIDPTLLARIGSRCRPPGGLLLLPNWVRDPLPPAARGGPASPAALDLRRRLGIPAHAFLASYSGNLGKKQGLGAVLDAARLLPPAAAPAPPTPARPVHLHLCGAGAGLDEIRRTLPPGTPVTLSPLLPEADYHALLQASDVCLVTQKAGTGAIFFPSKLLSLLEAGRPVVALADPDGALDRALAEAGAGWGLPPGDGPGLARLLAELAATPPAALAARAARGPQWVARFSRAATLDRLQEALARLAPPPGPV